MSIVVPRVVPTRWCPLILRGIYKQILVGTVLWAPSKNIPVGTTVGTFKLPQQRTLTVWYWKWELDSVGDLGADSGVDRFWIYLVSYQSQFWFDLGSNSVGRSSDNLCVIVANSTLGRSRLLLTRFCSAQQCWRFSFQQEGNQHFEQV